MPESGFYGKLPEYVYWIFVGVLFFIGVKQFLELLGM